ncbi:MAG: 2-oxoglutarate dehydrogenase E1 component, partial [Desulfobacterales bacterium]|nr:2-oxoglutarate dehydrogenase E1 component [Desulfobacterales bacterium]
MTIPETLNVNYIDSQYRRWKADPASVSRDWRYFFEGFDLAAEQAPDVSAACSEEQALRQSRVDALIFGYRHLGHLLACMDPLTSCPTSHPLLDLEAFGLESEDLESEFLA